MELIRTSDIYEAAYYLGEGYPPKSIECRSLNGSLQCDFYYNALDLEGLQAVFLLGRAQVNLLNFKRNYGELVGQLNKVKKAYKRKSSEQSGRLGVLR